ncbi:MULTISPECIES: phage tail protein, partial [Photorhabdus]
TETVALAKSAVPNSRKINGKALSGDVSLNAGDVGACRAYSGDISIGGGGTWTTDEFIAWLKQNGAFDVPYWMCKGSWSYASNRLITDTGCGAIHLAGAVVEVMGPEYAMTIRITTPTTTSGNGISNAQFTYINNGKDYLPGWRRDYNTANNTHPVGSPIPWPKPNPPSGYLACNGQAFNKSTYPQLAAAYPSGTLPDLRGEFIRGWDDGRGVDHGRGILSWQEGQAPISAIAGYWDNNWRNGKHRETGFSAATGTNKGGWHNIIQEYENQRETRPRNIAFNYIVRAA